MNVTVFGYLGWRFFYRIFQFLRHWYIKSARIYSHAVLNFFEAMDRHWALKITVKNIFKPLFGDYTWFGRIIGFWFRISRIFIGGIFYLVIFLIAVLLYIVWILIPPYLLIQFLVGIIH